jgi:hypothetical protein
VSGRQVIGLAACLALGGCSVAGQAGRPAEPSGPTQSSALATAQATHEYPSPPAPPQQASATAPSAIAAIAGFADRYINWDAQTVSAHMRMLAAISVGEARSAMQLAAAQTAGDYELQRGGIANSGVVEAIAPLGGAADRYVVVTREQTTATATTAYQGLAPAWHVAIATVQQTSSGRWEVSGWQPQS